MQTLCFDHALKVFLDSYLQFKHGELGPLDKAIFVVYHRLIMEAVEEPKYVEDVYSNYVLDAPKILDLCRVYGEDEELLPYLKEMVRVFLMWCCSLTCSPLISCVCALLCINPL